MRSFYIPAVAVALLTACASQTPAPAAPAKTESTPAVKAAEAPKAPQCYSSEAGKFVEVGAKAMIAGVAVTCKASADGKGAAWVGTK